MNNICICSFPHSLVSAFMYVGVVQFFVLMLQTSYISIPVYCDDVSMLF